MDSAQAAFMARLRETFRVEASEHLDALRVGLVALEHAAADESAAVLERVFREARSLRGAARSVRLAGVESLCLALENVFAALRSGQLELSTALLDVLLPALESLAVLCGKLGADAPSDVKEAESRTLTSLRDLLRGAPGSRLTPEPNLKDPLPEPVPPELAAGLAADEEPPSRPPTVGPRTTDTQAPSSSECTPPLRVPPPAPDSGQATQVPVLASAPETVRVSTQRLGALLTQAEELVGAKLAAGQDASELTRLAAEVARWNHSRPRQATRRRRGADDTSTAELLESELLFTRSLESSLKNLARSAQQHARTLAGLADGLLEEAKKALMLPCSYLLGTLPMLARELARDLKKQADLVVRGEDIEIDRRVLDELKDPLNHLLRNAIDHGLEPLDIRRGRGKPDVGQLLVTVTAIEGNRVELTVGDDGAGLDLARVGKAALRLGLVSSGEASGLSAAEAADLVFRSWLSTSPIITELSGRGLGLAIAREKVERLGGTIAVSSTPGAGTTFRMLLPLSLSTFRGVLVDAAGQRFVIPTANVVRVARVGSDELRTVENRETVAFGGVARSFVRLRDVLGLSGPEGRDDRVRPVVSVRAGGREVAFAVDAVLGEQEIMVKSLGPQLVRVRNVAGASISAGGAVIPILNLLDLVETARTAEAPRRAGGDEEAEPERRARLLLAEDSITARTLVKTILEGAGYDVVAAVDGLDALTALKTGEFDLVVSDVDMPRMNGFELTTRIRNDKKLAELPVVLVTALGSQKDREYGVEVGANAYIVKSDFDQSNLLEIVQRLI